MTREEEIRQEIDLRMVGCFGDFTEGYEAGFAEGAKWADETMIEKACEWIKKSLYYTQYREHCFDTSSFHEFIDDFKKAMEE